MSDKADRIFQKLIAIQVANGGEIPPDKGIEAIRTELGSVSRYFVAKASDGKFACEGYETGMGRTIGDTSSIRSAEHLHSPAAIMAWLGGHYSGYKAIEVVEYIDIIGETPFPPESEVWPEAD